MPKLDANVSKSILTVGCSFLQPKGGIAQVLYNYKNYIFNDFKYVINSKKGSKIRKAFVFLSSLIQTIFILIFDKKIKILHIHTASYNSFERSAFFVRIGKFFKKKIILHIHGGDFENYYKLNANRVCTILDKCDCLITLSQYWKKFFSAITTYPDVHIIKNPVSLSHIYLHNNRDIDNRVHFLFLGLIAPEKGVFDLIDTIAANKDILKDRILLHIGGNGEVETLNSQIIKYDISSLIIYEGWVSGRKKEKLFNETDVFILPSYAEGLPISILEAMSYKMPILTTPVGGIPEVVGNMENGILFTPGDKRAILDAIIYCLDNKADIIRMGEKSYQKILPYSSDNVVKELTAIYSKLLGKNL